MKIYTKKGDHLTTSTLTNVVYKNDPIIEINGTIDELQAHIMVACNFIEDEDIRNLLLTICRDLFVIGADISGQKQTLSADKVTYLEMTIDRYDLELKSLTAFILPGQTKASSFIHLTRTITRRTERVIVSYAKENNISPTILQYINRLSDLFFIIGRYLEEIKKC